MSFFYAAGYFFNNKWSIRIIIATWGIAAFLLQNYYTGDLTSYMTAPNPQPLVKTEKDLYSRGDIHLVTFKNKNADALMSVNLT